MTSSQYENITDHANMLADCRHSYMEDEVFYIQQPEEIKRKDQNAPKQHVAA